MILDARKRWFALFALIFPGVQSVAAEPAVQPSAPAYASTPECPEKVGTREFRSETIRLDTDQAFVVGTSRRQAHTCETASVLHLEHAGRSSAFTLSSAGRERVAIVDFSPDRSKLLLSREILQKFPNEQSGNVLIGALLTSTGKVQWRNAWDLLGWRDCDAMVKPQGFTSDGKIVIEAHASDLIPARRRSCVTDASLYEADLAQGTVTPLPDALKIERYARVTRPRSRTCAADPDLAGVCFSVHGRLSYWNGSVTTRIWWIGTKRILGVRDDVVPESVAGHLDWNVDAFGDYRVCPLTPQKPRVMQMVCIESAEKITYKSR